MNNHPPQREQRKLDHIKYSLELVDGPSTSGFEEIHLIHQATPELDLSDIDPSIELFGKRLSFPLVINALTGGVAEAKAINHSLARVSSRLGVAMAVGSQAAALENTDLQETFQVARKANPRGVLMANVSALTSYKDARRAVEMLEADALQVHLNVPQELAMGEGDRHFRGVLQNIGELVQNVGVPVVVKEVGFGISRETAGKLFGRGVRYLDLGGQGGTNFIAIEHRRAGHGYQIPLDWGISTAASLVEVSSLRLPMFLIASGGIRHPLDMVKAMALGAGLIGVAGPFLRTLITQSEDSLQKQLQWWRQCFIVLMLMVGASRVADLAHCPLVIYGRLREWMQQRGITMTEYGKR